MKIIKGLFLILVLVATAVHAEGDHEAAEGAEDSEVGSRPARFRLTDADAAATAARPSRPPVAAGIPDCWSQPDVYVEGKYTILIKRAAADAGTVDAIYDEVNRGYLKADGKPLSLGVGWFISTTANPPPNVRITKAGLRAAAERQLEALAQRKGVTISCNPIRHTLNR